MNKKNCTRAHITSFVPVSEDRVRSIVFIAIEDLVLEWWSFEVSLLLRFLTPIFDLETIITATVIVVVRGGTS